MDAKAALRKLYPDDEKRYNQAIAIYRVLVARYIQAVPVHARAKRRQLAFVRVVRTSSGEVTFMRVLCGGLMYDSTTGPSGKGWDMSGEELDAALREEGARQKEEGGAAAETDTLVFYSFVDQLIEATCDSSGDVKAAIFVVVHRDKDRVRERWEKNLTYP